MTLKRDITPQFEIILNKHFITFTRNYLPFNKDGNKGNMMILRNNLIQLLNTSRAWFSHDSGDVSDIGELKSPCRINVDREDPAINKLMNMVENEQQYIHRKLDSIFKDTKLNDSDNDYSRYEYRLACKVASLINYVAKNIKINIQPNVMVCHLCFTLAKMRLNTSTIIISNNKCSDSIHCIFF